MVKHVRIKGSENFQRYLQEKQEMAKAQTRNAAPIQPEEFDTPEEIETTGIEAEGDELEDEGFEDSDFSEEESIGFPPYWNPEPGDVIYFKPAKLDVREANFHRWVCIALKPMTCQTGPAEDAEDVAVNRGEFFTMSVYAALPLEKYVDLSVKVVVKGKREKATKQNRHPWEFQLFLTKSSKRALTARLSRDARLLKAIPF